LPRCAATTPTVQPIPSRTTAAIAARRGSPHARERGERERRRLRDEDESDRHVRHRPFPPADRPAPRHLKEAPCRNGQRGEHG
jgi:hypothetical protein